MGFVVDSFIQFAKTNPILTTTNVSLSLTFPLDDVLVPYLTGKIVTNAQKGKEFKKHLILLVVILMSMQIIYAFTSWHDAIIIPRLQNFVRHNMLTDLIKTFSQRNKDLMIGEVMSRLVKIPMTLVDLYELSKNFVIPYLISFLITASMIIRKDKTLGIVTLVLVLIVFGIVLLSPSACLPTTQRQEQSVALLDEEIEDVLNNLTTVYTSNQSSFELDRLLKYEHNYEKAFSETMACIIRTRVFAIICLATMLSFFAYRCYTRIQSKQMNAGDFVEMFVIIVQWFATLGWFSGNIRDIVVSWGILESFDKIKNEHDTSVFDSSTISNAHMPESRNAIVFDNVLYTVKGRGTPILDHVSFTINQYERIAIVGDIGSGKSTILKLLVGLIQQTSGEIYVDGVSLKDMPLRDLRKKIAYVQQTTQLFNRSVLDNITYGVDSANLEKVSQLVYSLGVADAFDNLGNGLNSMVGKNGSSLSGGQRQITAYIRTMIMNPEIVVLDEVTASIDKKTKVKLFNVFNKMFEKKTVIMVTHDPDMLQLATRVITVEDGHIISKS
jgi:ABC-type multidrug transport system fused ATPase/permease subunit